MNSFNVFSFCLFSVIFLLSNNPIESRKYQIKLKDIKVLTLKPNQLTTGRRSQAVPQLGCVGGYCEAIKGETVQCYNRGSDGIVIQWECKSNIKSGYKFGALDVICEGYDHSDDPYVLVGSCALEYRIDVDPNTQKGSTFSDYTYNPFSIGFVITLFVIIFIIYYTCIRPKRFTNGRDNRKARPPPPPGFRSDLFDDSQGCSSSSSSGYSGYTLGYSFGSPNNANHRNQSPYFGSRTQFSLHFCGPNSRSSGSSKSTTSGFCGTKRR